MKPEVVANRPKLSGKLTVMHAGSLTGMCRVLHEEFKNLNLTSKLSMCQRVE